MQGVRLRPIGIAWNGFVKVFAGGFKFFTKKSLSRIESYLLGVLTHEGTGVGPTPACRLPKGKIQLPEGSRGKCR